MCTERCTKLSRGVFFLTCMTQLVIYLQQIMIHHVLPPKKNQKPFAPQLPSWLWGFFCT